MVAAEAPICLGFLRHPDGNTKTSVLSYYFPHINIAYELKNFKSLFSLHHIIMKRPVSKLCMHVCTTDVKYNKCLAKLAKARLPDPLST